MATACMGTMPYFVAWVATNKVKQELGYIEKTQSEKKGGEMGVEKAEFDAAYRKIWRLLLSIPPCTNQTNPLPRGKGEYLKAPTGLRALNSDDEEAVTAIANVLENLNGPQRQPCLDLYTPDIYVPVTERSGSTLPAPVDIKLTRPKQPEAGITKLVSSTATFNLFFGDNEIGVNNDSEMGN
ncbi:hypothetical protein L211DRAFT_870762 [Terfezia boudieri ATCC MYA-4762]|uniref:Uncharacterized protein n=1 Tax=Terfezia boudieri ATCC MYA-4762 TaxID=1051890 RepID=A0A3N4LHV7_9PEZI|nr:hypothetical protein L211DRAFT_870762 [Terfezia boudieri ATCC MYA-4762]